MARDLILAASLGFGAMYDNYLVLVLWPFIFASSTQTIVLNIRLSSRDLNSQRSRKGAFGVSAGMWAGCLVLYFNASSLLHGSTTVAPSYVVLTLIVPLAGASGWSAARLHAAGKSAFALAVPFFSSVCVALTAPAANGLFIPAAALVAGWAIDLVALRTLETGTPDAQSPNEAAAHHQRNQIPALVLGQAIVATWPIIDRLVATRLGPGVLSATYTANRFVFTVPLLLVGSVIPHLTRRAATGAHVRSRVLRPLLLVLTPASAMMAIALLFVYAAKGEVFFLAAAAYTSTLPFSCIVLVSQATLVGAGRAMIALACNIPSVLTTAVGGICAVTTQTVSYFLWATPVGTCATAGMVLLSAHNLSSGRHTRPTRSAGRRGNIE